MPGVLFRGRLRDSLEKCVACHRHVSSRTTFSLDSDQLSQNALINF